MNFLEKYWPYLLLGIGAIWLIPKLLNQGNSQVVNRVIPVDMENDRTELQKLNLEYLLGREQLASSERIADKQIAAEKTRLDYAFQSSQAQNNMQLKALDVQARLQERLADIASNTSLGEAQGRYDAQSELLRQQRNNQLLNNLFGLGSSLLSGLLKPSQSQQGSRSPQSGGSGGSIGQSPNAPSQAISARDRQNALARVGQWLTNQFYARQNAALQFNEYGDLGYADAMSYDSQWFDSFGNPWYDWDNYFATDPQGIVTSDYDILGGFDYFNLGNGFTNVGDLGDDWWSAWDYYYNYDEGY
jgi:hypothetical protein